MHIFLISSGKVTGSVSGKTDFVLVGKDPGRSKVSVCVYVNCYIFFIDAFPSPHPFFFNKI